MKKLPTTAAEAAAMDKTELANACLDAIAENARLREALEETCNALEAATAFHYAKGGFPFKSSKQTLKQARAALAGEVKP